MVSHEYIRYIPSWKKPRTGDVQDENRIQLSPISAIAASQSRARVQNILTGLSMLMVLSLVYIGTRYYSERTVKLDVSASMNLAHSVTGKVGSVDYKKNTFSLIYMDSQDSDIASIGIPKWTVYLPPGERFTGKQSAPLKVCSTVDDLSSLQYASPGTCASVIQPGNIVLLEYIIVNADAQSMVAKSVIGQSP